MRGRRLSTAALIGALLLVLVVMLYRWGNSSPRVRATFFRMFCAVNLDRVLAPRKFITLHDPQCRPIADLPDKNLDEPVMGVIVGSDARAYTLREAIWHHIIHDEVAGIPILVTYCNLTFTPIIYDLSANPGASFTVHGLYENNMIMKRADTEELWLQATGVPHEVERREGLTRLPTHLTTARQWARHWPHSTIFVGDDRCKHEPGRYPHHEQYLEYFHTDEVALPLSNPDTENRLRPKEVVTGVFLRDAIYALPNKEFSCRHVMHLTVPGQEVVVFGEEGLESLGVYDPEGRRFGWDSGAIRDSETGSEWNVFGRAVAGPAAGASLRPIDSLTAFWFAMHNHFPEVELVRASDLLQSGTE